MNENPVMHKKVSAIPEKVEVACELVSLGVSLKIPKGPFEAIIFDCDGTLVHSMPQHFEAWREALSQHGAKGVFGEDVFYAMGGRPAKDIVSDLNLEFGLKLDADLVALTKRNAFLAKLQSLSLIEEVARFAQQMRGKIPLAVATGSSRVVVERVLCHLGISDWFDEVICCEDVSLGKPAPDIYLHAARVLGVDPAKCLVFEDAPVGIEAGRKAGMQVVEVPMPLLK